MAKYTILKNKTIDLPDDLVEFYEKNFDKLDERKLSYLAYVADVENSSDIKAITSGVIDSIFEEMMMYLESEHVMSLAREKGYLE